MAKFPLPRFHMEFIPVQEGCTAFTPFEEEGKFQLSPNITLDLIIAYEAVEDDLPTLSKAFCVSEEDLHLFLEVTGPEGETAATSWLGDLTLCEDDMEAFEAAARWVGGVLETARESKESYQFARMKALVLAGMAKSGKIDKFDSKEEADQFLEMAVAYARAAEDYLSRRHTSDA